MKRLACLVAALLLVAGCGSDNTDPRQGRVMLDSSNCGFGDCYELYKLCIGPDLHTVYDEAGNDDFSRVDEDSPECAEAGQ